MSGTWAATEGEVRVTWFGENGSPPRNALAEEVAGLSTILNRPLATTVDIG